METSSDDAVAKAVTDLAPLVEDLGEREAVCPQHGAYQTAGKRYTRGVRREYWTPCPACAKAEKEAEEAAAMEAEARRRQERLAEAVGRAAIPARFAESTFDTYVATMKQQGAVLRACQEYAANFHQHRRTGESLVLIGRRGVGKTHLAVAVLHALLPEHVGLYTTAQDMISMIRSTWGAAAVSTTDSVMRVLYEVPLLVIDEVGVQGGGENEQNLLFQVLDRRYRERKPVVLLGNMQIAEMQQYLGERVLDRLREIAQVRVCEWDSYRAQARKNNGV